MASKGDKAAMEPMARRFYADGKNLTEISGLLGVSVTTLSRWKSDTLDPNQDCDEWERARQQKLGSIQRLEALYQRQLKYLEDLQPEEMTSQRVNTVTQIAVLLARAVQTEKAEKVADEVVNQVKKAGFTAETYDDIREHILGIKQ